jgi:hypothetical protein
MVRTAFEPWSGLHTSRFLESRSIPSSRHASGRLAWADAEMLGHADIKTTMRYAHALVDDVAEAMTARVIDEAARRSAARSRSF